jgi:site-specific recombinase XerD
VVGKLVPVFTGDELSRLERACAGRSFTQRRDTAVIAVLTATCIRLSELAGLRCTDIDLWQRELTVRGKGGKDRIVKIGHQGARSLDRYLRARSRHAHAWRPQLWLGADSREPLTAAGIYQMTAAAAARPASTCTRTGSGATSAIPGWTAAAPNGT